jgi:two-component system OmpR family sensor kinase
MLGQGRHRHSNAKHRLRHVRKTARGALWTSWTCAPDSTDPPGLIPDAADAGLVASAGALCCPLPLSLPAASPDAGTAPLIDATQWRQALAGEASFTTTVSGDRSRLLAIIAHLRNGRRLLVVAGTGTDVSDDAVDDVQTAFVLGGPPAVVLAGVGAWLLAGAALRPVERMRREAADISDRDTGRRLAVPSTHDEIAALGSTINGLLARLQGALARERSFVADASHELRTPLAILHAELELAARPGRSRDELIEAVNQAGQETDRLIRLAEDLLLLARADNAQPFLQPLPLVLPDLLGTAARGAGARAAAQGVTVAVHSPSDLTVVADPDRLRQALDNLLDNASRHAPAGSVIEVNATANESGMIAIEIADRGPGFPVEFLPHAFERFHRAEAARTRDGGGTGLGLSIVQAIIHAHGGQTTVGNRPGGGATVKLTLPAHATTTRHPRNGQAT